MSWPEIIAQRLPFAHFSLLAYDWFFSMFWLRDFCRNLDCLWYGFASGGFRHRLRYLFLLKTAQNAARFCLWVFWGGKVLSFRVCAEFRVFYLLCFSGNECLP